MATAAFQAELANESKANPDADSLAVGIAHRDECARAVFDHYVQSLQ